MAQKTSWFFKRDITMGQGENGSFSHAGSFAMDMGIPGIQHIPYYAPCDVTCKMVDRPNAMIAWESDAAVEWVNGTVDYISFYVIHDNSSSAGDIVVGKKVRKGELLGHTGWGGNVPAQEAGDHVHLNTGRGKYTGGYTNSSGTFCINNEVHNYDVFPNCDSSGTSYKVTPQAGVPTYPWKCNGGGGESGGGGGSVPSGIEMLKVNRFMFPEVVEKTVEYSFRYEKNKYSKYHHLRKTLNEIMRRNYPDIISRINSLQGEFGLEKICCNPTMTITLSNGKGVQSNYNLTDFNNQEEPFKVSLKGFLGKANRVEMMLNDYLFYSDYSHIMSDTAVMRKDSLMDQTPKNFDLFIDAEKSNAYLNENRMKQSLDNASFALSQNKLSASTSERNFKMDQERQNQLNQISQTGARKQLDISQTGSWMQFGVGQTKRHAGDMLNIGASLLTGNFANAAMGTLGLGFDVGMDALAQQLSHATQNNALNAAQATQNQALAANQGSSEAIFMNSLSTSNLIASNNYENAIANINAGLADLKNQPDISAVSGSDYNFEMAFRNDSIYFLIYTINPHALLMISEFYAMFGYSIKRYDSINKYLRVRSSFNYIKTQGANIQGDIPTKFKNALNMIFDNGITFWTDKDKMITGDITGNL